MGYFQLLAIVFFCIFKCIDINTKKRVSIIPVQVLEIYFTKTPINIKFYGLSSYIYFILILFIIVVPSFLRHFVLCLLPNLTHISLVFSYKFFLHSLVICLVFFCFKRENKKHKFKKIFLAQIFRFS